MCSWELGAQYLLMIHNYILQERRNSLILQFAKTEQCDRVFGLIWAMRRNGEQGGSIGQGQIWLNRMLIGRKGRRNGKRKGKNLPPIKNQKKLCPRERSTLF